MNAQAEREAADHRAQALRHRRSRREQDQDQVTGRRRGRVFGYRCNLAILSEGTERYRFGIGRFNVSGRKR